MCLYNLRAKQQKPVKFKKRRFYFLSEPYLSYGDCGLYTTRQFRFESVYFRFINKVLRKKYRKKKLVFSKQKYWIRFNKNIFLSKKAKNARMGSGKGKFLRASYLIKVNKPFIETRHFNVKFLSALRRRLHKKIPIFTKILQKNYFANFIN